MLSKIPNLLFIHSPDLACFFIDQPYLAQVCLATVVNINAYMYTNLILFLNSYSSQFPVYCFEDVLLVSQS